MQFYRKGEQHLIENYDKAKKDNFKGWCIHHRLELTLDGEFAHSKKDLERLGMYYNRPYFELIYLTVKEHKKLHSSNLSQETLRKRSLSLTGKKYKNGKTSVEINKDNRPKKMCQSRNFSKKSRLKMSLSAKKRGATKGNTGMHWFTNGKENVLSFDCPQGYTKGRKQFK